MTRERQSRLIISLLFVLVTFVPACAQEAPLNGFDDYVNRALLEWASDASTISAVSLSEEELKKFAGQYESKAPPLEESIEIVGGKLKAMVPSQPVYTRLWRRIALVLREHPLASSYNSR